MIYLRRGGKCLGSMNGLEFIFFSVIFIHRIIEVKKQYYIESYRRYFKTNSYSEN